MAENHTPSHTLDVTPSDEPELGRPPEPALAADSLVNDQSLPAWPLPAANR
jgi:hypothetical protein